MLYLFPGSFQFKLLFDWVSPVCYLIEYQHFVKLKPAKSAFCSDISIFFFYFLFACIIGRDKTACASPFSFFSQRLPARMLFSFYMLLSAQWILLLSGLKAEQILGVFFCCNIPHWPMKKRSSFIYACYHRFSKLWNDAHLLGKWSKELKWQKHNSFW